MSARVTRSSVMDKIISIFFFLKILLRNYYIYWARTKKKVIQVFNFWSRVQTQYELQRNTTILCLLRRIKCQYI